MITANVFKITMLKIEIFDIINVSLFFFWGISGAFLRPSILFSTFAHVMEGKAYFVLFKKFGISKAVHS